MYSHTCEYMYVLICSYIHVFTAGFARTYMYSHVLLVHTCIHMYIHVFTGQILALQCDCGHTHTRTHTHTHALSRARSLSLPPLPPPHTAHTQKTQNRWYRLLGMSLSHSRMLAYDQSLALICWCTLNLSLAYARVCSRVLYNRACFTIITLSLECSDAIIVRD
jgi:hypothetical protein